MKNLEKKRTEKIQNLTSTKNVLAEAFFEFHQINRWLLNSIWPLVNFFTQIVRIWKKNLPPFGIFIGTTSCHTLSVKAEGQFEFWILSISKLHHSETQLTPWNLGQDILDIFGQNIIWRFNNWARFFRILSRSTIFQIRLQKLTCFFS